MTVVPITQSTAGGRPEVPGHLARVLNIADHDPGTFTVPELAAHLKLSVGTTYEYLRRGAIPARRVGRRWIISRRRIARWLEEITEQPAVEVSATGSEPYPWEVR